MNPLTLKAAKRTLLAAGYDATEISALIRGIKADAWDKGAHHMWSLEVPVTTFELLRDNPYRKAKP